MDYVGYIVFGFFYQIMLDYSWPLGLAAWLVFIAIALFIYQRILFYLRK
jgi:hypothetical protein